MTAPKIGQIGAFAPFRLMKMFAAPQRVWPGRLHARLAYAGDAVRILDRGLADRIKLIAPPRQEDTRPGRGALDAWGRGAATTGDNCGLLTTMVVCLPLESSPFQASGSGATGGPGEFT
jgi:hypothetical protein